MTTLADVLAGLADVLADDAAFGVDGSDAVHLRAVAINGDWLPVPTPSAMVLVTETTRTALDGKRESVTAMFEVRLAIPGPAIDPAANPPLDPEMGDMPGIVALVEGVRRVLIEHDLLASGSPAVALLTGSAPKGETYEVQAFKEYGWFQTAIVRWQAGWVQPRTFVDGPVINRRLLTTIRLSRELTDESVGTETVSDP